MCFKYRLVLGSCRVRFYRLNEEGTEVIKQIDDIPLYSDTVIIPDKTSSEVLISFRTHERVFSYKNISQFEDNLGNPLVFADFDEFVTALLNEQANCDCCTTEAGNISVSSDSYTSWVDPVTGNIYERTLSEGSVTWTDSRSLAVLSNTFIIERLVPSGAIYDTLSSPLKGNQHQYKAILKFGQTGEVDIVDAPKDVWNGPFSYEGHDPTTSEVIQISSTSANDTSGGTGARTLQVFGLKTPTSTEEESEIITLNGTTLVTLANTWYRLYRAKVLTAGSSGANEGFVNAVSQGTTSTMFSIPVGSNQTTVGAFTIPAETEGLLMSFNAGMARTNGSNGSAIVSLRVREPGSVYQTRRLYTITNSYEIGRDRLFSPEVLMPGTDIKVTVESVSDNSTTIFLNSESLFTQFQYKALNTVYLTVDALILYVKRTLIYLL